MKRPDNNWNGSFTDLDAKKNGKAIQYSIAEVSFKSVITGDATKAYVVTNTHVTKNTRSSNKTLGKKPNRSNGTNTGTETNVHLYSLTTIISLLAIVFFKKRFVK